MKFANIIYNKRNDRLTIGDDMQLLGIENLYKYMGIDYNEVIRIEFSELSTYDGEYVILPISFPFLGYTKDNIITKFSDKIIPVFLGFCILTSTLTDIDIAYLKKYEPIGCRDVYTLNNLRSNGIQSYLNTCMTLCFPKVRDSLNHSKKIIYCVDISEKLKSYIPKELLPRCKFVSHNFYTTEFDSTPEELCKKRYQEYIDNAELVITDRLHAGLPCAAAGIPVIFAKDKYSWRFTGIDRFLNIYDENQFENINWNPDPYDFEDLKEKVLEISSSRVWESYNKYKKLYDLSWYFENMNRRPYYIEFLDSTYNFLKKNYTLDSHFNYILWGVSQTASEINKYINENYKNAKLIGVIDRKKRISFCGINSEDKNEVIKKYDNNTIIFVTVAAAIKESNSFFNEHKIKNYFQCCEDGMENKLDRGNL